MKELKVEVLENLTVEEESERLRLERKVEKAFFEAGLALQALRDKRLWRSTHYSFKEYCQDRFAFSKSQSYRLIDAVEIGKNIYGEVPNWGRNETIVLATAESQLRPLKRLHSPERQQEAWAIAVEEAGGKVPTAKIVREVVDRLEPQKTKARKTSVKTNISRTRQKTEYVPIDNAQIGQNVRVKSYHSLFPLQFGVIVQIPNNRSVIVDLENNSRELVDIRDLEIQVLVESNGSVKTPAEGPNRIPGAGLDWYVRVDEPTFKALDAYARKNGIPTLGMAIARLLEEVED